MSIISKREAGEIAGIAVFWAALFWWVVRLGLTLPRWPTPTIAVALCFLIALRHQFNVVFFIYADLGLSYFEDWNRSVRFGIVIFQCWVVVWCNTILLFVERNLEMACRLALILTIAGTLYSSFMALAPLARRIRRGESTSLGIPDEETELRLQAILFNTFLDVFLSIVLLGIVIKQPLAGTIGPIVASAAVLLQGAILWKFGFSEFLEKTRKVLAAQ